MRKTFLEGHRYAGQISNLPEWSISGYYSPCSMPDPFNAFLVFLSSPCRSFASQLQ
jgi:hypothetical protein